MVQDDLHWDHLGAAVKMLKSVVLLPLSYSLDQHLKEKNLEINIGVTR